MLEDIPSEQSGAYDHLIPNLYTRAHITNANFYAKAALLEFAPIRESLRQLERVEQLEKGQKERRDGQKTYSSKEVEQLKRIGMAIREAMEEDAKPLMRLETLDRTFSRLRDLSAGKRHYWSLFHLNEEGWFVAAADFPRWDPMRPLPWVVSTREDTEAFWQARYDKEQVSPTRNGPKPTADMKRQMEIIYASRRLQGRNTSNADALRGKVVRSYILLGEWVARQRIMYALSSTSQDDEIAA